MATMLGSYSLPDAPAAAQSLRDLQMKSAGGLSSLMDTAGNNKYRKQYQKALYDTAAEGINTAADRARQSMVEGTFAKGVGPSSITVELAGRGQQEHADALARAAREAFTGAGAESRADLAAKQGLYNTGFGSATTGLQGEANVALTNLAREQQESQFGRNLEFQGSENALNRASQEGMFGKNLGLQYAQLGQQNEQFGRNLEFQGGQNDLNRALQKWAQESSQGFQGTQADLNRAAAAAAQASSQGFQGEQNEAQRALTKLLAEQGQTYTAGQNQLTRDQQMQMLLLQLANQRDIAGGQTLASGLTGGIGGLGALLAPALAQIMKQWGGGTATA